MGVLRRGSVVLWHSLIAARPRFSVVWDAGATTLVLLPILVPRFDCKHDVELDLADLVACRAFDPEQGPPAGSVVRTRRDPPAPRDPDFYQLAGELPEATMCRVVQGVIRSAEDTAMHARWSGERRHREHARDRAVHFNKAV